MYFHHMPKHLLLICASGVCLLSGFSSSTEAEVLKRADLNNDGQVSPKELQTHIENFFYGSQNFTIEEIDLLIDVYFD